jgi:hypothetical protein
MTTMEKLEAAVKKWRGRFLVEHAWPESGEIVRAAEAVLAARVRPDDPEVLWLRGMAKECVGYADAGAKLKAARILHLLDCLVGPEPWVPKKGERVRGYVEGCMVEGPYSGDCTEVGSVGHRIGAIWVERVERIEP